MRRVMIAGNWKMNKDIKESTVFLEEYCKRIVSDKSLKYDLDTRTEVILFPSTFSIYPMSCYKQDIGSKISLGVQNVHWMDSGPLTGEVSTLMALHAGASYALVGHSERRHVFGENDLIVKAKFEACSKTGLKPFLCVGETENERNMDLTGSVLEKQVSAAISDTVSCIGEDHLIIAYEPVWAIGTGNSASSKDAQKACSHIRSVVRDIKGLPASEMAHVLYGGSVNLSNSHEFLLEKDIDGLLVGGASLDPVIFAGIVKNTVLTRKEVQGNDM